MTKDQMIEWIDNASYEMLLSKWRFALPGDPFFDLLRHNGEVARHYREVMAKRRSEIGDAGHTQASKTISWD